MNPKHSLPLLSLYFLLVSCNESQQIGPIDPGTNRLAVGDVVEANLPGGSDGTVSSSLEFDADSGKAYTISWSDPGFAVAVSIVSSTGEPRYSEATQAPMGFEKSILFPATRSGAQTILVTGIDRASFRIGLGATNGLPGWVAMPDHAEEDGLRSLAKYLPTDSTWQYRSLTTSGKPDVDWFWIQADSGTTYSLVRVDSLIGGVSMGLYDADSGFLGGAGWYCRKKATVYCRIAAPTGKGGWYRLRALATKGAPSEALLADAYENDNTLATAKPIATDSSWQVRTLPDPRDLDLISFQADSGHTYRVLIRYNDTTGTYHRPVILNKDSTQQPNVVEAISKGVAAVFFCVRTGRYFAAVTGYGGPNSGYSIAVTQKAGVARWVIPENGEQSSGISSATLLPTDSAPLVKKVFYADTEWVRIHVEAGKVYTLRQKVVSTTYTWIGIRTILLGSTGCPFDSLNLSKSDRDTAWTMLPRSDGDIYLKISTPTWSYVNASDWLSLEFRLDVKSPPPDPLEPDNSLSQSALLVADGKPVSRWVAGSDVDWMKIQVDSGRKMSIRVDGKSGSIALAVDLFGSDSQWIESRPQILPQSGASNEYIPRRTGLVHLRVRSTGFGVQPYEVSAQHSALSDSAACSSLEQACVLATDSLWRQTRLVPGLARWFAFPVKAGSVYRLGVRSNAQTNLRILGPNQLLADSLYLYPSSSSTNLYYHATADGIAYAKVGIGLKSDTAAQFFLSISVMNGEWWPPSPSFAGAWDLAIDRAALVGDVLPIKPIFFKFRGDLGKVYSFHLDQSNSMDFSIYSQDSVFQSYSTFTNYTNTSQDLSFAPPWSGLWYIRIRSSYNQAVSWHLQASSALLDTFENDDAMIVAHNLPIDGTVQNHILWGTEVDWVRLDIDSGVEYKLQLESEGSQPLMAQAFTTDSLSLGRIVLDPTTTNNEGLKIAMNRKTQVFVCVSAGGSFIPGTIGYKIWIDKPKSVLP